MRRSVKCAAEKQATAKFYGNRRIPVLISANERDENVKDNNIDWRNGKRKKTIRMNAKMQGKKEPLGDSEVCVFSRDFGI